MKINYRKFLSDWKEMKSSKGLMERSITDAFAGAIDDGGDGLPVGSALGDNQQQSSLSPIITVGDQEYNVIEDNDINRKKIVLDPSGGISSNSPVVPVGKNQSGGFVLIAKRGDMPSQFIPATSKKGIYEINYPQVKGDPYKMDSISKQPSKDIFQIADQDSITEISKMYGIKPQLP